MRIALLASLVGLAACSREPANTIDVSAVAAQRAQANIDNYAAANVPVAKAAMARPKPRPTGRQ